MKVKNLSFPHYVPLCTAFGSAYTAHKWIQTGLKTMCPLPSIFLDLPRRLCAFAQSVKERYHHSLYGSVSQT